MPLLRWLRLFIALFSFLLPVSLTLGAGLLTMNTVKAWSCP